MWLPRPRFTVRSLMIAVAIAAVLIAVEISVFAYSKNLVSDYGDGKDYIPGEAWAVWAIIQIPVLLSLVLLGSLLMLPIGKLCIRHDDRLTARPSIEPDPHERH